jgi:hypothetical protein
VFEPELGEVSGGEPKIGRLATLTLFQLTLKNSGSPKVCEKMVHILPKRKTLKLNIN